LLFCKYINKSNQNKRNTYLNLKVVLMNFGNTHTLRKKGTKAVTGAVPFQKVHFCTQRLPIGTLVVHIST